VTPFKAWIASAQTLASALAMAGQALPASLAGTAQARRSRGFGSR
jgi:hypothetical protein